MNAAAPMQIPDHLTRTDLGSYMRDLRLHYGLSEQEVSEQLHIRSKYITAIEAAEIDAMPGKTYARGYIQTYAEFLGLDAVQIVQRFFAELPASEPAPLPPTALLPPSSRHYALYFLLGAMIAAGIYLVTQPSETLPQPEPAEPQELTAVPDEYLATLRDRPVPTPTSYDCFGKQTLLGCYRAQRTTREWVLPAKLTAAAPAAPADDALTEAPLP